MSILCCQMHIISNMHNGICKLRLASIIVYCRRHWFVLCLPHQLFLFLFLFLSLSRHQLLPMAVLKSLRAINLTSTSRLIIQPMSTSSELSVRTNVCVKREFHRSTSRNFTRVINFIYKKVD